MKVSKQRSRSRRRRSGAAFDLEPAGAMFSPRAFPPAKVVQAKPATRGELFDRYLQLRARPPATPARVFGEEAAVQRQIRWTETSNSHIDLVDTIMSGADFGFTAILVNGNDNDQFNPTPLTEPTYDLKKANGVTELTVASEATNDLGTRMELPAGAPWQRDVDKARVGGRLLGDARVLGVGDAVTDYATGSGQTRLRVKGTPSDGALSRLTKDHEQYHVNDDKAAKEAIVDPWDALIAAKKRTQAVTVGATPIAALQQFYNDVGGSGADIGRAYMAECVRRGNAYHGTDPGSKPTMTEIATVSDQSAISVTWRHPVEEGLLRKLFKW